MNSSESNARSEHRPILGAQIMDDPAATEEKIDLWFRTLADYDMPLARVFVPRGEEGLRRMDWFFRAAEKHGVGITATLGGQPSPESERWILEVVERYQGSPALDSWILINEPGWAPASNPLAVERFRRWLRDKYGTVEALNRAWGKDYAGFDDAGVESSRPGAFSAAIPFLDWYTFWRSHLTWHLHWIAERIRKVDAVHPTHVNPHALITNLAANSQDLPAWRSFLSSLGASAHPSWHFGLLGRDQYALGISYICDLIHGASEPKPFWITELQGGNNTNSGTRPLCPMPEDIAQWVWTGLGSGADRVVFWLLNNRSFAVESGEWSLLDLQNQPGERLETAGRIARIVNENAAFFQESTPVKSPITIFLSLETMSLQERFEQSSPVTSTERGAAVRLEGRGRNAHVLAALAFYETLQEMGIPVRIKHIHDFEWDSRTEEPQLAILPNIAALSADQAKDIETFVLNGNTALITGLTGAWDPENRFWSLTSRFPLEDLVGATLREIRTLDTDCQVSLLEPEIALPSHLWVGEIANHSAHVIGRQSGWITAVRKHAGAGEVFWIPSLVDVGAWLDDHRPLGQFLASVTSPFVANLAFRFAGPHSGCLLRVLRSGEDYLTVIVNGAAQAKRLQLRHPDGVMPTVIWREGSTVSPTGDVTLAPRGTVVALWRDVKRSED